MYFLSIFGSKNSSLSIFRAAVPLKQGKDLLSLPKKKKKLGNLFLCVIYISRILAYVKPDVIQCNHKDFKGQEP